MLSSPDANQGSSHPDLDLVFKALGDPTRRELIARLTDGPAMVTELAEPFNMSLPAVGKHLRVLEKAGLVNRAISGRVHWCSLNPLPLKDAGAWLLHYQKFWDATLDSLGEYFENDVEHDG